MLILSLALLFLNSTATAQEKAEYGCQGNCPTETGGEGATASAEATLENSVVNEAVSTATSSGGTGGSSNVSTEITEIHPDDLRIRNVVSPGTPNSYPTATCRIARSAGFSLPGAAVSGGNSVEDVECTLRETARSFNDLGAPEMGLYLLCTQSEVINGRFDRRGDLEGGSQPPIGADECLRLLWELRRPDESDEAEDSGTAALEEEVGILRDSILEFRSEYEHLYDQQQEIVEEVRVVASEQRMAPEHSGVVPPQVQYVEEPFLNAAKRSALLGVLEE